MINDIYNRKILEFAADIPRLQRLPAPDATAVAHSRLCGSKVTVDLKMDGRRGHRLRPRGEGLRSRPGFVLDHGAPCGGLDGGGAAKALREQMYAMLKDNGPPPAGKWADLEALLPVRDFKARHASTLLTFDAVADAVAQIEAKQMARPMAEQSPRQSDRAKS